MNGTARAVVVVGSGPTGLLAGDLATAGVPVTVAGKRPRVICDLSRAFVPRARTLKRLDVRGPAGEPGAACRPPGRPRLYDRPAPGLGPLPSGFPRHLVVPRYEAEEAPDSEAALAAYVG
ncbi:FAD-dependent monooxygenase [Streptomyces marokkonensis]|uniref:FAD-dependent monooxygenase n=1 Tax=Streptomyces marokkonensis TaxID=324855 RepID=A0ABW6Q951_9ACTN